MGSVLANHTPETLKESGSYFTPPDLAQFIAKRILKNGLLDNEGVIRILDPACGDGELLQAMVDVIPDKELGRIHLLGTDTHKEALEYTRKRLAGTPLYKLDLVEVDFLETYVQESDDIASHVLNPVHAIIANPPYVRTQVMGAEKAQELAGLFGLSGRIDLYQAFLVGMTAKLLPNGILGVITSNRFLSIKSGITTRQLLNSAFSIEELYDLGDTKFFEAAVLPAVFIGKKKKSFCNEQKSSPRFVRIYEGEGDTAAESVESIISILEHPVTKSFNVANRTFDVSTGVLRIPEKPKDPWELMTDQELEWVRRIEQNSHGVFGDFAKIRVGVKTTADNVFIRSDWGKLEEEQQPESDILFPLLSRESASGWITGQIDNHILYTHFSVDGKRRVIELDDFPKGKKYLEQHKEQLSGRNYVIKANRAWYEIWVPQNPALWVNPKLVFPDISNAPRFFYDDSGSIVNGNCYWITLPENQSNDFLYLLQGVANSKLMTRYHDLAFNNKLYSGRRRYLTQYVEKYPTPNPGSPGGKKIIDLVKQIISREQAGKNYTSVLADLEKTVAGAFKVPLNSY